AMMVLVGLGMGPALPLYTLIVQNAAGHENLGVVTAGATFSRMLGQVVGVTVFGAVFAALLGAPLAAGPDGAALALNGGAAPAADYARSLTSALATLYRAGIGIVLVGFLLTLRIAEPRLVGSGGGRGAEPSSAFWRQPRRAAAAGLRPRADRPRPWPAQAPRASLCPQLAPPDRSPIISMDAPDSPLGPAGRVPERARSRARRLHVRVRPRRILPHERSCRVRELPHHERALRGVDEVES